MRSFIQKCLARHQNQDTQKFQQFLRASTLIERLRLEKILWSEYKDNKFNRMWKTVTFPLRHPKNFTQFFIFHIKPPDFAFARSHLLVSRVCSRHYLFMSVFLIREIKNNIKKLNFNENQWDERGKGQRNKTAI